MKKVLLFITMMLIPAITFGLESNYDLDINESIDLGLNSVNCYYRYTNYGVADVTDGSLKGINRGISKVEIFRNNTLEHSFNVLVDSEIYYTKLFNFLNGYTFAIDMKYIADKDSSEEITKYMVNYLEYLYNLELSVMFPQNYTLTCNLNDMTCQINYLNYEATFNIVFDGIYSLKRIVNMNKNETHLIEFIDYSVEEQTNSTVSAYLDSNNGVCSVNANVITALNTGICQLILENDYGEYTYLDVIVNQNEIINYYQSSLNTINTINLHGTKDNTFLDKKELIKYELNKLLYDNYGLEYEIIFNEAKDSKINISLNLNYSFYKEENNVYQKFKLTEITRSDINLVYLYNSVIKTDEIKEITNRLDKEKYITVINFIKFLNEANYYEDLADYSNVGDILNDYGNHYTLDFIADEIHDEEIFKSKYYGTYYLKYDNEVVYSNLTYFEVVFIVDDSLNINNQQTLTDDLVYYLLDKYWEVTNSSSYNLEIEPRYLEENVFGVFIHDYDTDDDFEFGMKMHFDESNYIMTTSITSSYNDILLRKGHMLIIDYIVRPINATNRNVLWNSLDSTIVSVNNGTINALKPGNTKVIVNTTDINNITKEFYIVVYEKGDANQDNKISVTDLTILRKCLAGLKEISQLENLTLDITEDAKVTTTDLIKIRKILAGINN